MIADKRATAVERKRHADGVAVLDGIFKWKPEDAPKRAKHCQHDRRWRRRKISASSRRRNRA